MLHFYKDGDNALNFVKKILPNNPIILEAGGFDGTDTRRMKNIWPGSTLHVFEPLPNSFVKLQKAISELSNVMLYPYALSNYSGRTNFYVNSHNEGASSIDFPANFIAFQFIKVPIEVECVTINDWVKKFKISHIDFMWLDIEGRELYVLESALNILQSVRVIYTEVNYIPIRKGGCVYSELKLFLEKQGFKEVWKSRFGIQGNALFQNNSLN